ncbi:HNH endonuclease [Escherichia coli]|nr:HNH endonuclease [Escherichia coli]
MQSCSQIFCCSSLQVKIYYFDLICFLLPVCPNCHAMLHRRKPPFTPEELKALMDANKSN